MMEHKKIRFWERATSYIKNVKRYLIYGEGDCKVTPLQQNLLDAFLPALRLDVRKQVLLQLSQPFKISFYNGGKISPIYFRERPLTQDILIHDPEFDDRLYMVEMFVDGRKQYANVNFYKGRLFSFEFNKPLKFYEGKKIRFGAVSLGNSKQSFAAAIDRQEHGKNGQHATGRD